MHEHVSSSTHDSGIHCTPVKTYRGTVRYMQTEIQTDRKWQVYKNVPKSDYFTSSPTSCNLRGQLRVEKGVFDHPKKYIDSHRIIHTSWSPSSMQTKIQPPTRPTSANLSPPHPQYEGLFLSPSNLLHLTLRPPWIPMRHGGHKLATP